MHMTIIESYQKARDVWTNKMQVLDLASLPAGWKQNEAFHACYHACNGPSARNFSYKLVPETDDFGNIAVFLKKKNRFHKVEATDRGVELTTWLHPDIADKIDEINENLITRTQDFLKKIEGCKDKKDQILRIVMIEELIDDAINNAMNQENADAVYFSIGKVREFAANISMLMAAPGFNLIQLTMNKWMSAAQKIRASNPEAPFPGAKVKPLLADALKWKKFIMEFLESDWEKQD